MASEAQGAHRQRNAARGWVTRVINALGELLKAVRIDVAAVEVALADMDLRVVALDNAQATLEVLIEEEDLESIIEDGWQFRQKVTEVKVTTAKRLADLNRKVAPNGTEASGGDCMPVRLPVLDLPVFSGDICQWASFWGRFSAMVDVASISDVAKFSYLESLLKDEAKACICGLPVTSANYEVACEILEKRYGRREAVIFAHIQQMLGLNTPGDTTKALWTMHDSLRAHLRALEALDVKGEKYGIILNPIILSRLPETVRLEWARDGAGHEGDVDWLLTFLYNEVQRRERSEAFNAPVSVTQTHVKKPSSAESFCLPSAAALHSNASTAKDNVNVCGLCERGVHALNCCSVLLNAPLSHRRDLLRGVRACFRCLRTGKNHDFRRCEATCGACHGRHHAVLCEHQTTADGASSTLLTSPAADQSMTLNSSNSSAPSRRMAAALPDPSVVRS